MNALAAVAFDRDVLTARFGDGREHAFHALWLRDHCPCSECVDPGSGQRLHDTALLPGELEPAKVTFADATLTVEWPDGHLSAFPVQWLKAQAESGRPGPALWDGALAARLPVAAWAQVEHDDDALAAFLRPAAELGFALLTGVPPEPGRLLAVVDRFGYVRETNYGRTFDVRSRPDPWNLADSQLALGLHTDNPYRDPVPTLQLLHCLVASGGGGGETILVDGFRAADELRRTEPEAFALLAEEPVLFEYRDPQTELVAWAPVIECDPRGGVRAIRFNNRSLRGPLAPPQRVAAWYRAYRRFAELSWRPDGQVRFRLAPGDLVLFDNERVLHGRTAFTGGERLLQGCYADRDALRSRLAVLDRTKSGV